MAKRWTGAKLTQNQDLGTYLDEVVYPSLFNRLDSAFPEFGWKPTGKNWTATIWPPNFSYPVNDERPERLVVYSNRPHWIKVHGHTGMRFLDYVNDGRKPQGTEFPDTIRTLCERAGIPFPEQELSPEEAERFRQREERRSILTTVGEYTQEALWHDTEDSRKALRFLIEERGFTEDDIRTLGLGYFPSVPKIRERLEGEGHPLQDMINAGVLWPKLEGYILVPWNDAAGHPLTFYGRWHSQTSPEGQPKTLALPGEGTKASPLFFDRARKEGHKDLVAVEGIFDASLLQARGDHRVIAYGAAQFSHDQVETLQRFGIQSVIICPDPDGGGDRGAQSSVDQLTKANLFAYVTPRLPDGLDPDEFLLREGMEGWTAHVDRAIPGPVYRAQVLLGEIKPESPLLEKEKAVRQVAEYVKKELRGSWAGVHAKEIQGTVAERTQWTLDELEPIFREAVELGQEEALERQLDQILREAQTGRAEGIPLTEIWQQLQEDLASLATYRWESPPSNLVRLPQVIEGLMGPSTAIPVSAFGGNGVNRLLNGGLQRGRVVTLGAGTGRGKTTWALQLADGIAEGNLERQEKNQSAVPILFVAADNQDHQELIVRSLARLGQLDGGKLESKAWQREPDRGQGTQKTLKEAQERYQNFAAFLTILDSADGLTVANLRQEMERLLYHHQAETGLLVIDPLHGLRTGDEKLDQNETERVSKVAAQIKQLAVELDVAILALSDTTKEGIRTRNDGELGFRGSYQINHRSDVTLFLQVSKDMGSLIGGGEDRREEEEYLQELAQANPLQGFPEWKYTTYATLVCSKQRTGRLRSLVFAYHKATHTFEELEAQ